MDVPAAALKEAGNSAAKSLAAWIGRNVDMEWTRPERVNIENSADLLGPSDDVIAACTLEVHGAKTGRLVLVIDPMAIACFINGIMGGEPQETPQQRDLSESNPHMFWDEMARSAALETANIVACAYLNAISQAYLDQGIEQAQARIAPGPPRFTLDFAGSLSEFLLADLSESLQGVMVSKSHMMLNNLPLNDWRLIWIPITPPSHQANPGSPMGNAL